MYVCTSCQVYEDALPENFMKMTSLEQVLQASIHHRVSFFMSFFLTPVTFFFLTILYCRLWGCMTIPALYAGITSARTRRRTTMRRTLTSIVPWTGIRNRLSSAAGSLRYGITSSSWIPLIHSSGMRPAPSSPVASILVGMPLRWALRAGSITSSGFLFLLSQRKNC